MSPESLSLTEEQSVPKESRFGDKEKIVEIMQEGETLVIHGRLEQFLDIDSHTNIVELAEVCDQKTHEETKTSHTDSLEEADENLPRADSHRNIAQLIELKKDSGAVLGIFKPYEGEEASVKGDIKRCYNREKAAYLISEHFDFDLVPPTITRDGGSLQLFMDPRKYSTLSKLPEGVKIDRALIGSSEDYLATAAYGWITLDIDRRDSNYLVNVENPEEMIDIDNGLIMGSLAYLDAREIYGPSHTLTCEHVGYNKDGSREITKPIEPKPIPENILDKIKDGLENKEELTEPLREICHKRTVETPDGDWKEVVDPEFTEQEIAKMWRRAELLVEHGVFLSRENLEHVVGITPEKAKDII